jgi:hypothetical protein
MFMVFKFNLRLTINNGELLETIWERKKKGKKKLSPSLISIIRNASGYHVGK